jgi:hypothetical protein
MRYAGLLPCLLLLSGCGYTQYLSDADQHGGTVNFVDDWSQDAAFDKAKAHCAQYHRDARRVMSVPGTDTLKFLCEEPGVHPVTPFGGV